MPQQHRQAAELTFDEEGGGVMQDTVWRTRRLWTLTGESTSAGRVCKRFEIRVLNAAGREDDAGTASVFLEDPGWMMAQFDMRCGSAGFYLFSRTDLDVGAQPPSWPGRLRPVFTEAWAGVPAGVRPHLALDFPTEKGSGSGAWGAWRCSLTTGMCSTAELEVVQLVGGAPLPVLSRTVVVRAMSPGMVSFAADDHSLLRMIFAWEPPGSAPAAASLPEAPVGWQWSSTTFYVGAGDAAAVLGAEEPSGSPTPSPGPLSCFSGLLGAPWPARKNGVAPFLEGGFSEETDAPSFCLNSMLVGSEAEGWWEEAVRAAEQQLLSGSERMRFWALLLLAAVARGAGASCALVALAGVSACRDDTSERVSRAATRLLSQVAEPQAARAQSGEDLAIRVPWPSDDVAGEGPDREPALVRPELEAAPAVRQAACAALQRAPLGVACGGEGLRLVLLSNGSRGDVQPLVVLAKHLQARGCQVHALVRHNLVNFCKERSLDATAAFPDLAEMLKTIGGVSPEKEGHLRGAGELWRLQNPGALDDPARKIRQLAPDAVLWSAGECHQVAFDYEESPAGVPAIPIIGCGLQAAFDHFRDAVTRTPQRPFFVTTSPLVDNETDTSGVHGLHQSGAWLPEEDPTPEQLAAEPLASLAAFLEAGPPPVAVGWGSMLADSVPPGAMLVRALVAVRDAGQRAVVIGGWARLDELGRALMDGDCDRLLREAGGAFDVLHELRDEGRFGALALFALERCFFLAAAPHCWLFPRCACVVHHGGAGTTHAVLSCGTPCVITPIAWDQFHWAKTVERLGVGHGFDRILRDVTAGQLAHGIRRALGMAEEARTLGERMRQEPGVEHAAEAICRFLLHSTRDGAWKRRREALHGPRHAPDATSACSCS